MTRTADRPVAVIKEQEPWRELPPDQLPPGQAAQWKTSLVDVLTVFLTGATCPIGCNMCDLHQYTVPGPLIPGQTILQVRDALKQIGKVNLPDDASQRWIKLYNSGNFFDRNSVPPADYKGLAELCRQFERIIVENHPLIGASLHDDFLSILNESHESGQLEIAVGLETIYPGALERIGKRMQLSDFDRYAHDLAERQIALRTFLIVGFPDLSLAESIQWALRSVRYALEQGTRHVSLIPARPGDGWAGRAGQLPRLEVPALIDLLAESFIMAQDTNACISLDLWDLEKSVQGEVQADQLQRLQNAILSQSLTSDD